VRLSTQVLVGIGAGIVVGLFFGEIVAPVGVVGRAFILLLQMTVLPYVAFSLIKGLGSLTAREATTLARNAGGFLLLLWAISMGAVLLFPLAFPDWPAASFFSTSLVEEPPAFDFLRLFIPANLFESLAQNVVPAVVVFSISLGIALISIEGKDPLIRAFSILTDALGSIAAWVVRLAPYGVFAIAAEAAGTMDMGQIRGLQVYVVAYIGMSLLLSFWVLPGLVTTLTPFRYREIFDITRGALVTAFATGNLFVVLAVLTEKTKELVRLHVENAQDADSFVDVVVPTAYTLPTAGKLLTMAFVLFAGWLSGFAVSVTQYPAFAISGLVTFFGNTYVAVPFLLDMLRIPSDTMQLFAVTDNLIGSRFGALMGAMHILVMGLLSACATAGLIRISAIRIARYAAVTVVATLALLLGVRFAFDALGSRYEGYQLFIQRDLLEEGVPAKVIEGPRETLPTVDAGPSALDRIRGRGVLRVGYWPDSLPRTFRNEAGRLVGFDVELMHHLARDLGVTLEFVRTDFQELPALLRAGYLDLGIGLAVTPESMEKLSFTVPLRDDTLAFIVEDHRRSDFDSRKAVKAQGPLRIAIPAVPYYVQQLRKYLPQAEFVEIDSPRPFLSGELENVDALVYTAEDGSAWCLVYPRFSVAVPHPDILRLPVAIPMARGDEGLADFLNLWIQLKQRDQTLERLFDYWYRGKAEEKRTVRWSVLRNVLGWGEVDPAGQASQEDTP
jgi:Na+/H+-dicarboxylate symporter